VVIPNEATRQARNQDDLPSDGYSIKFADSAILTSDRVIYYHGGIHLTGLGCGHGKAARWGALPEVVG
jgi:hypothetical protein